MADQEQPDWSSLPSDLLELIGQRSRDAVTGVVAFRSVCRAWRAAVRPAPRLMLPRRSSEHAFVFPLSRGWSIIVDAHDASCHLSHLATGATAAMPSLNAVWDGGRIKTLRYEHRPNLSILTEMFNPTYLYFTDLVRFAVHNATPDDDAPPAAEGTMVMMYHMMMHRECTGVLFCRPGDAAWTKVENPDRRGFGFFDFAYHDGRMFGMDELEMAVYDAATLAVLHQVRLQRPPATRLFVTKMYHGVARLVEFGYVHLVALPSKLVLVRTSVKYSRPVAFNIFELVSTPEGLAWLKVRDAGNYELFVDGYHTTFRENRANTGTLIYYVHDEHYATVASAYCYSVQDNKLECVYRPPKDGPEFSTKPSWFVP
jgi:hypothetical protein